MSVYDLGDEVRVSGHFTTISTGADQDPTAIFLSIKNPSGTLTTYQYGVDVIIVKDSVGDYHADIDANVAGLWYYRWFSTGTGKAADEGTFEVEDAEAV